MSGARSVPVERIEVREKTQSFETWSATPCRRSRRTLTPRVGPYQDLTTLRPQYFSIESKSRPLCKSGILCRIAAAAIMQSATLDISVRISIVKIDLTVPLLFDHIISAGGGSFFNELMLRGSME